MDKDERCPCNTGEIYGSCCGRYHLGYMDPLAPVWPASAVELMRSRYSAFAMMLPEYLLATWHPSTRPEVLQLDEAIVWKNLEIVSTEAGGPFDKQGVVEFVARYALLGQREYQHEVSDFVREGGRWYYLDAVD